MAETPEVGMGATRYGYSDRHAMTVIKVSQDGRRVRAQYDHAKRTDDNGMSECQAYEFTRNTDGAVETFSLRKNGRWVLTRYPTNDGPRLVLGHRDKYHDFSF